MIQSSLQLHFPIESVQENVSDGIIHMDRLIRTKLGTETNKMNPEEIEKSFKDEEESEGRGEREREKEA